MDPLIIGGIIAGIGALASGITNAISSRRQQQRANAFNKAQTDLQWQREQEQQQFQNEYNSPANQRKLLEEAGYNVNYTDASALSADAAAPSPIEYAQADFTPATESINKAISQFYSIQQMESNMRYQKAVTEAQEIKNGFLSSLLGSEEIIKSKQADYATYTTHGRQVSQMSRDANELLSKGFNEEEVFQALFNDGNVTKEQKASLISLLKRLRGNYEYQEAGLQNKFLNETYTDRVNNLRYSNRATYSNANEAAMKADYIQQISNYVNSRKDLSDLQKSTAIMGMASFIYNGQDSGLNPLNYVNPISFAKSFLGRPQKNVYNSFNKTNIINN